jgi:hypothetical protein
MDNIIAYIWVAAMGAGLFAAGFCTAVSMIKKWEGWK